MTNHEHDKPAKSEQTISPEKLRNLKNAIATFLGELPPRETTLLDYDGILSLKDYDTSIKLARSGGFLNIFGTVIHHQDHGIIAPVLLHVSHGSEQYGPDHDDDFELIASDSATHGDTFTLDDSGKLIDSAETLRFVDSKAIAAREAELLADPDFSPVSFPSGIVMPNVQATPTGEVYTDGEILTDQAKMGAATARLTLYLRDSEQTAQLQRTITAHNVARQETGTAITDERAERAIAILAEALETLPRVG